MTIENIVKTSISLVSPSDFATFADVRKRVLKGHTPAPTLVYMSALVQPDWKVEIEAIAVQ